MTPWLGEGFELAFEEPVPICMGENGAGNSTRIEPVAARRREGWLAKVGRDGVPRAGRLEASVGAALLRPTHCEIARVSPRDADHFRLWQAFVAAAIAGDPGTLV